MEPPSVAGSGLVATASERTGWRGKTLGVGEPAQSAADRLLGAAFGLSIHSPPLIHYKPGPRSKVAHLTSLYIRLQWQYGHHPKTAGSVRLHFAICGGASILSVV